METSGLFFCLYLNVSNYLSIKELSPDDQPREKLATKGRSTLSDAEILAILIGSGSREKSAVTLCQEILKDVNGDLNKLARLTINDLKKYKGIGEAKAISIVAALELGRRRKSIGFNKESAISSSKDVFILMADKFNDKEHEEFYIILLNRANKVKSIQCISKGGISATMADGKIIFKKALEKMSSAIILCHNHPSGNLNPSKADVELTKKISTFGKYIELPILDHLIITDRSYFSFADEGML